MRHLTRRMAREGWRFSRPVFNIDDKGVGHGVYTAQGLERAYSLVAFAHDLPDSLRSDRVIAEAWDATFTLFDGIPAPVDIRRLAHNVPLQEAGRISEKELSLSRANRSARLWQHVVDSLAAGRQPQLEHIDEVGYLMRTTAVYGSGKFGAADRETFAGRKELHAPFQAEMLSIYLARTFIRDLVEFMARIKGGAHAVGLRSGIARRLGIGNSTGLGMAPFLVNHPMLLNNWILAREEAVARVRHIPAAGAEQQRIFLHVMERSALSASRWRSQHPIQVKKLERLNADIASLRQHIRCEGLRAAHPWDELMRWAEATLSEEGQEWLASLILEPYGELVDDLCESMARTPPHDFIINGAMTAKETRALLRESFAWALHLDWNAEENRARVWYVSEEKLEPRLGERFSEPIADFEQPLAPARDAAAACRALENCEADQPIAEFLLHHPEHRQAIRRAQMSACAPYGEIRDNTIGAALMPIDMLRAKLSFFGATHFDPRSDRWVRICMYAGAPYPEELTSENADLWVYPQTDE